MKDEVKLSLELANIIIGYLGKRPYEEVYQIIQRMEAEHKANRDADAMQQNLSNEPIKTEE